MLRTDIEPFSGIHDLWLPANQIGKTQWVEIDRLMELLTALSDELGGECDEEISEVFPYWGAHKLLKEQEEQATREVKKDEV